MLNTALSVAETGRPNSNGLDGRVEKDGTRPVSDGEVCGVALRLLGPTLLIPLPLLVELPPPLCSALTPSRPPSELARLGVLIKGPDCCVSA